mgnify:CR=1 FL=1
MSYWKKRQEETYKAGEMTVNQYFTKLEKAFNQAKRDLQKTVESFYWRYAEENSLTYTEAQKRLDKAEIGELQEFIDLAMANIGKYNQEVNNMSIKARMTRYQALEAQVDAILRQLYAVDYQSESEKMMSDVYKDTYYRTWYDIDRYRGFHSQFAQIEPKTIENVLKYPFNGANFSDRLWKQKDHLQGQIMEALTTMLIQGTLPQNLAKDFAKKMQTKKFDAYRLLHTESSYVMSEATHAGYKEDGVEKYQILATLDSKTCGICGELDGKIYPMAEAVTGKNMPPFHPFCRCTDVPYYPDTPVDGKRVARDAEGNSIEVPESMTYVEWKKKYIQEETTSKPKITDNLSLPDSMKGVAKDQFDKEVKMLPDRHKDIINKAVVKVIVDEQGNSRYDRVNGILYLAKELDEGEAIHEMAHALETQAGVWEDERFLQAIYKTIGDINPLWDAILDEDTFVRPITRLADTEALVSIYQGRLYEEQVPLINENMEFNVYALADFFAEAYREYILNPYNLKRKQPEIYRYIDEEM